MAQDYAELEKRLREYDADSYTPYDLLEEAADALASLTKELEWFRAMLALIPEKYRTDGDTSFWIGEYDPVHRTTGRSMSPEERDQLATVAYKVLGCAISLRSSGISRASADGDNNGAL